MLFNVILYFQSSLCNGPVCGSRLSGHKAFARVSNCAWIMNKGEIRINKCEVIYLTISHVYMTPESESVAVVTTWFIRSITQVLRYTRVS